MRSVGSDSAGFAPHSAQKEALESNTPLRDNTPNRDTDFVDYRSRQACAHRSKFVRTVHFARHTVSTNPVSRSVVKSTNLLHYKWCATEGLTGGGGFSRQDEAYGAPILLLVFWQPTVVVLVLLLSLLQL